MEAEEKNKSTQWSLKLSLCKNVFRSCQKVAGEAAVWSYTVLWMWSLNAFNAFLLYIFLVHFYILSVHFKRPQSAAHVQQ